ncbi:DUF2207 domain-containing protein [Protaetiibacter larvae]|uniref:DUF2207 domain-containing protein n=1 Tax=Protaetiibacter larvae TaxID=2592654 RepID=A0A5C1Y9R0_9MICO|nr:DUF2207 domain-containing protein [Protaetiibacter larvae]QEO09899.1 DUF2207 domain-containing protein [Protaetiibacter larvae]
MRHHRHRHHLRGLRMLASAVLAIAAVAVSAVPASASASAPPPPAAPTMRADVNDFTIPSFDIEYRLSRDATGFSALHVVETIVADFQQIGQNHGIERALPMSYGQVDLELRVLSVRDETGAARQFTTYDSEGLYGEPFRVLRIGSSDSYVHGLQSYVIEYTMRHVVGTFEDTGVDEFYWDLNGDGWAQPIAEVTARLHLTPELQEATTGAAACYAGIYGGTTPCELTTTPDGFAVEVAELQPYQTVTWSIAFAPGTFRPGPLPSDSWFVRVVPWVLLGVLAAALLVVLWLRIFVFRDARGRGVVIAQYEPYPELGVMEAAQLLGRESKGLPAQFVQLVVARAARLIDRGEDAGRDERYRLELLDPSGLDKDDAIAVASIFGSTKQGAKVDLDRSDQKLGDRLAALVAKVRTAVSRDYRATRATPVTTVTRLVLFANGLAAVVVGFWATANDADPGWLFLQLAVVIIGGMVVFGFAGAPERLTRQGALALEHLHGIREYLQLAEADRIRVLQSPEGAERTPIDTGDREAVVRLNERLLPYAIIFGIEDQWQRELGTLYATTPSEIASTVGALNLGSFAAGYAAASFATTPPPSTSSSWSSSGGSSFSGGSSGGGFSGGGGGGGGGGGW